MSTAALAAVASLRAAGFRPARPIGVAAFTEEEGGRFGVPIAWAVRLLTGAIDPAAARELRDGDGVRLADAMRAAGRDPAVLGPDDELLAQLGCYVELHVEQGSAAGPDARRAARSRCRRRSSILAARPVAVSADRLGLRPDHV